MKTLGLRGGYKPWNSLESFKKAKEAKLDGVQLDVWLTADNKLAVLHGGTIGEIILHPKETGSKNYGLTCTE
tara:strand:+ start:99 stop:314 length:216 start_codon:yes stop_codon:yes gene_type:complete